MSFSQGGMCRAKSRTAGQFCASSLAPQSIMARPAVSQIITDIVCLILLLFNCIDGIQGCLYLCGGRSPHRLPEPIDMHHSRRNHEQSSYPYPGRPKTLCPLPRGEGGRASRPGEGSRSADLYGPRPSKPGDHAACLTVGILQATIKSRP